ncbi:MAG: NfeD family protein [Oscillospiraceae bacterium]|jgi:membrane protein implicated in regulation of membrane protease activity|nr:NfeD family protein [Oscillospiraceae bacterium]
MENTWIVWLALVVGALILESLSQQLFSIWFALGALVALLADLAHAQLWLEIILFVAATVISLLATRPLVRRMRKKLQPQPTNADRCVGQTADVLQDINNLKGTGQIKVQGQVWTARTADGSVIEAGQTVRTIEIQGAKMIVALND